MFALLFFVIELCLLQYRYDKLNQKALLDAQLYDKTGRVRSPSPVALSDSEEDHPPATEGKGYCKCPASVAPSSQPHAVPAATTKIGEGCSSPKPQLADASASEATAAEDTDSDYQHSESESEYESSSEEYAEDSADDASTEDDNTVDTREELGALATDSSGLQGKTPCTSKSKSQSDRPSTSAPVRVILLSTSKPVDMQLAMKYKTVLLKLQLYFLVQYATCKVGSTEHSFVILMQICMKLTWLKNTK